MSALIIAEMEQVHKTSWQQQEKIDAWMFEQVGVKKYPTQNLMHYYHTRIAQMANRQAVWCWMTFVMQFTNDHQVHSPSPV